MNIMMPVLSARLKKMRKERQIKQEEVAAALADFFGVTTDDLLGRG